MAVSEFKAKFPDFMDICREHNIEVTDVDFDTYTQMSVQRALLEMSLNKDLAFKITQGLATDFLWIALDFDNEVIRDNIEKSGMKIYTIIGKSGHRWLPQQVKNPLNLLMQYADDGTLNLVCEAKHEFGTSSMGGKSKSWNVTKRIKLSELRDLTDNKPNRSGRLIIMNRHPKITMEDIVHDLITVISTIRKESKDSPSENLESENIYPQVEDISLSPKVQNELNDVIDVLANGSPEAVADATKDIPEPIKVAMKTATEAAVSGSPPPKLSPSIPPALQKGIHIATALATGTSDIPPVASIPKIIQQKPVFTQPLSAQLPPPPISKPTISLPPPSTVRQLSKAAIQPQPQAVKPFISQYQSAKQSLGQWFGDAFSFLGSASLPEQQSVQNNLPHAESMSERSDTAQTMAKPRILNTKPAPWRPKTMIPYAQYCKRSVRSRPHRRTRRARLSSTRRRRALPQRRKRKSECILVTEMPPRRRKTARRKRRSRY